MSQTILPARPPRIPRAPSAPILSEILAGALLSLAALVSNPPGLRGQEPTGGPDDPFLLPRVVVSATRVPIEWDRLPTPVSVLTGARIRRLGIRTVGDALRSVPGLHVFRSASAGSQTSVFVRGGESDYVKVLVDGVPVNGAGGAIDFADLSTDQVERIEVVRGPASVLYGSDAVSGVIQIFTRRGRGEPRLEATVSGGIGERRLDDGTHAVMEAEASLTGSTDALSYSIGGGRSWSGGTYPLNNENELNTVSGRLGWSDGGTAAVALATRFGDGEFRFPTDLAGNLADENQRADRRSWTTSLLARRRLSPRVEAELQLGLADREQISRDEPDGPDDTRGFFASVYDSEVQRSSADLRVTTLLDGASVTIGGAFERATGDIAYSSDSEFGESEASADFERSNAAGYLEVLAAPLAGVQATLGARMDDNETFGSFDTYRVGVSWSASPGIRVRGALGRAFREPTFAENFGSGFADNGNPDLVPERTRSWEVGLEGALGPVVLSGTWFDQRFRDLIQYTFVTSDPADPNYMNVGRAKASGLEVAAEGGWGPIALNASYMYLDTEVVDPGLATDATFVQGEPLLRRPASSGSLSLGLGHDRGNVGAVVSLVGGREDVDFAAGFPAPRVTLGSYATVDVSADYRLPDLGRAGARFVLKLENLLDADYEGIVGFPAPGRVVRLGLAVEMGG